MIVFVFNIWRTRRHGAVAGPNPWGGATLEWSIPSPPPVHNFDVIPTVTSRSPLWDAPPKPVPPPGHIHVPAGSWWPMVAAAGLPVMALAPLTHTVWIVFVGAAILLYGIYRWAYEPFEV
jgi:heme/copper-type cytochrome/quinol oxidase subunit 1